MKLLMTLLLLTVLTVYVRTTVVKDGSRFLNIGNIEEGDRLLYSGYLYQEAIPNSIQHQDLTYNGISTRISLVQAYEARETQFASAWIVEGGIGANNVTVRVQSARGFGFYYMVTILGQ